MAWGTVVLSQITATQNVIGVRAEVNSSAISYGDNIINGNETNVQTSLGDNLAVLQKR